MSEQPHAGGPVFPRLNSQMDPGMSLRDWFAGQALAGLIGATPVIDEAQAANEPITQFAARVAYKAADAMLAARGDK